MNKDLQDEEVIDFIVGWINRMVKKHSGVVRDKETGEKLDLGQALCRLQFGINWKEIVRNEDLPSVDLAKEWEDGKQPEWAEFI